MAKVTFDVLMPLRAFIDSDEVKSTKFLFCLTVLMPLRAFIDSDQLVAPHQGQRIASVLMPLRAFIDSDQLTQAKIAAVEAIGLNALTGIY